MIAIHGKFGPTAAAVAIAWPAILFQIKRPPFTLNTVFPIILSYNLDCGHLVTLSAAAVSKNQKLHRSRSVKCLKLRHLSSCSHHLLRK